ncbi:S-layer homology domain-containing protein [Bacillus sp. CGMCC 1.16541]|uniref:S-layer homology domain-containing protein n=1 Tax=Bacillus sp. CGMCC 1.16541 TaxID=2185143 RepID=UPI001EF6CC42|nr:S-layer homology domain-containing protein [Bacillus sp. CGMCC 1.16541]
MLEGNTGSNQGKFPFNDVPAGYEWAKPYIQELVDQEVTTGVTPTEFQPGKSVTRAQFVTMIGRALKVEAAASNETFKDVKQGEYYTPYVLKAAEMGLVKGDDGFFKPNAPITREQMALIITRLYDHQKVEVPTGDYKAFKDYDKISPYAREAIGALKALNIISGKANGTFAPRERLTRAQSAKVLVESLQHVK